MTITIDDDEATALLWALDKYLPELGYEIARIDLERDRHGVARLERSLTRLRDRLRAARSAGDAPMRLD